MRIPQRMEHFDGRYKQVPLILTGKFTHIEYSYDFLAQSGTYLYALVCISIFKFCNFDYF